MNKKAFKTAISVPLMMVILIPYMFCLYKVSIWLTANYPILSIGGTCILMFIMLLRIIYLWEAKKDGPITGNRWFTLLFSHIIATPWALTYTYPDGAEYKLIGWIMSPFVVSLWVPFYFLEVRNIPKKNSRIPSNKERSLK